MDNIWDLERMTANCVTMFVRWIKYGQSYKPHMNATLHI